MEMKCIVVEGSLFQVAKDYELCGICGFDHEYDCPYLDAGNLAECLAAHEHEEKTTGKTDYPEILRKAVVMNKQASHGFYPPKGS